MKGQSDDRWAVFNENGLLGQAGDGKGDLDANPYLPYHDNRSASEDCRDKSEFELDRLVDSIADGEEIDIFCLSPFFDLRLS
jgi:hypothetical protein